MKILHYKVASELPSQDIPAPGVPRMTRGANPVNATQSGKRETMPLDIMANPRMKHPKLNKESWSTSYAQARSEPRMSRTKARAKRQRRINREGKR